MVILYKDLLMIIVLNEYTRARFDKKNFEEYGHL